MRKPSRRQSLVALAGIVAALGIGVPAALAEPASITGTINADDTGDPLPGVCVFVYDAETFDVAGQGCADAGGAYEITGLETGVGYRVEASRSGEYLGEWAVDKRFFDEADIVSAPSVVNFGLRRGAAITGTITAQDTGGPLSACVDAVVADTFEHADFACADEAGHFALTVDPVAGHKIRVGSVPGYVGEWAFDKRTFDNADVITAPATVEIALTPGASISGTVTAADTGAALPGICVGAYDPETFEFVDGACSDDAGSYVMSSLLSGASYKIEASAFGTGYLTEWAVDKRSFDAADRITAPSVVDFALEPAVSITGTVTAEDTGEPLADVCVTAYDATTFDFVDGACSDAAGSFVLPNLQEGTGYKLEADAAEGFVDEWAFDKRIFDEADVVTAPGVVDFALERGATVEGTVTAEDTGEPVPNVCVTAYEPETAAPADNACTDESGRYAMGSLQGGVGYKIEAVAAETFLTEWAFDKRIFDEADVVTAPAVVDFALERGATVEGLVIADDTGEPIAQVCVAAFDEAFSFVDIACADEAGRYALTRLEEGVGYRLEAATIDGDYIGEWYDDKTSFDDADVVVAPAVADFGLQRAGHLRGTVFLSDGSPAEFAFVEIWDLDGETVSGLGTDELGQWSVAVRPGTYKILASLDSGLQRWAVDARDFESADAFAVAAGEVVTVDVTLPSPATIEGSVTDARTGQAVEGVCVDVVESTSHVGGSGCTDVAGRYSVSNLAAGSYTIHFTDFTGNYVSEWYPNAVEEAKAHEVRVDEGQTLTINTELKTAGDVTGRVVDGGTRAPLVGVCVVARDPKTLDAVGAGDCSDDQGRFTLQSVPPGDVLVSTHDEGDYAAAYAPGTWDRSDATLFKVRAGESTDIGEIAVPLGGILRGRITNEAGDPVEGIVVTPLGGVDRSGEGKTATTDANGEYELRGLSGPLVPGVFDPAGEYGFQWSGGAADPSVAEPVEIRSGQPTLLNWVLRPGSILIGTVVDENGEPASVGRGFELSARDLSGRLEIGAAFVRGDGATFEIRGLPDGPILLRHLDREIWYDAATSAKKADPIPLSAGETTEIAFTLPSP